MQEGCSSTEAAKQAGITSRTVIYEWMKDDPIFKKQHEEIRQTKPTSSLPNSTKLPLDVAEERAGPDDIITEREKEIFLSAYKDYGYNVAEACLQTGIKRSTVVAWFQTDAKFDENFKSAVEDKKDFFEGALMKKIAQGDIAAIIFATKVGLKNRDTPDLIYEESPRKLDARIEVVHSKEEIDAIVRGAELSQEKLSNIPSIKLLAERVIEAEVEEIKDDCTK